MKPPLTPTALFFAVLALFCLLFGGCAGSAGARSFTGLGASTTLYENGKPVLATSGNHLGVHYHKTATETEFSSASTTHDVATGAQWGGLNGSIDALGSTATKAGNAWAKAKGVTIPTIPSITPK